jgi:DNA helicase-2/ATP-dependent DNA helicase PcrA
MGLNAEQVTAINSGPGAWLVLATAGSGKTTVLTQRVKRLILEGVMVDDILALTFTTGAAEEMQDRLGLTIHKTSRGGFRTFHSFGLKLLMAEKAHLSWTIADNPFASNFGMKVLQGVIKARFGKRLGKKDLDELKAFISKMKRSTVKLPSGFTAESIHVWESKKWGAVYHSYNEQMHKEDQIDYDDMIVEAVNLLEQPEIRARWQFKYVLADEGQDTDDLQFRTLQLVSERDKNIFLVGDINQSLYGFRGAKPGNLTKFVDWFPGAQTLILPENFRSSPEIVAFSQKVAPVKNELTANMRTANPHGADIEIVNYLGNDDEAENVLDRITELPGKSAVLARTNQQIGLFETVCTLREVKFHLLGKSGFWRTSEIKNVLSLVGFVLSNKAAETYPQRLIAPVRSIQAQMRAQEAVRAIIEHARLRDLYDDDDYEDNDNFALANLNGVINIAQRFATLKEFYDFANRASHASRKSKHAITLGTIHSAKGLEWDNVFFIGAQDGRIPHEKATDLHEERCIFYVAVSRPSKVLQVSYSGQRSRFLDEIEAEEELA